LLEPPVAYRADTLRGLVLAACASLPIWSCSVWGLPCLTLYSGSGALLPHLFTLTPARRKQASCGMPDPLAKARVAEAVSSLWHWPSMFSKGCPLKPTSRTLSGTLPCGVRTFLPRFLLAERPAATAQLPCCLHSNLFALSPAWCSGGILASDGRAEADDSPARCTFLTFSVPRSQFRPNREIGNFPPVEALLNP